MASQLVTQNKSKIKFLGVWFDETMKFEKHVTSKYKLAAMNIHYIKSLRKHLTIDSAKQMASAMVISHLDYSNGVLVGLPDTTIHRLQSSTEQAELGCKGSVK
jgi:hypothetical protein